MLVPQERHPPPECKARLGGKGGRERSKEAALAAGSVGQDSILAGNSPIYARHYVIFPRFLDLNPDLAKKKPDACLMLVHTSLYVDASSGRPICKRRKRVAQKGKRSWCEPFVPGLCLQPHSSRAKGVRRYTRMCCVCTHTRPHAYSLGGEGP